MKVLIRHIKSTEIKTAYNIQKLCWPPHLQASLEDLKTRFNKNPKFFLVAEYKGKIVGYAYSIITKRRPTIRELEKSKSVSDLHFANSYKKGYCFYGHAVAVHPKYQKLGIGKKLLLALIKLAKSKGFNKIFFVAERRLDNYYKKLGALPKGRTYPYLGKPHRWWEYTIK